ncbi:MAG: ribosome small subunit-dependent GTPase A [Bacteroidia bacterium]|nr:ribosome small subunit-dependent GTPase A [Bacteroidia bacterium]MDW8347110.1 ribosome small subunit-dependent GTPase A [Bacteroidia bacterium]
MSQKIGIVTHSKGSSYTVLTQDSSHQTVECRIKGKLRLTEWNTTNPIAVGDIVHFTLQNDGNGLIYAIQDRKNAIIRKSISKHTQAHIIASNIDQLIILATLAQPRTSLGFIDRMLVITEAYKIPYSIIIWNKADLYDDLMHKQVQDYIHLYQSIGYTSKLISTLDKSYLSLVASIVQDKISAIVGHSGTGKSSLLNFLQPSLNLKVGKISHWSSKGRHTTTLATMYPLTNYNAYIIDTPGIKELDFFNIQKEEVSRYYIDFLPYLSNCKFSNCLHLNEPHCAVKNALEQGRIHSQRYQNYLGILQMLDAKL